MPRIRPLRFSTLVAVCSLAIAVGSFGASLVLLDALVLRPVRVDQPATLLHLGGTAHNIPGYDAEEWWMQADGLRGVGLYATRDALVDAGGLRQLDTVALVSKRYFEVLGHTPTAGRLLTPADAGASGAHAAVVSPAFASARWGSPQQAPGAELTIEGLPYIVVGVVGRAAEYPRSAEVWVLQSDALAERAVSQRTRATWAGSGLGTVGRLAPDTTLQVVQQQLDALLARLNTEISPLAGGLRFGDIVRAVPLQEVLSREPRAAVFSFVAASLVGLLLAALTCGLLVANQQLAQQREWAMRQVLGATPRDLRRQIALVALQWSVAAACVGFVAMHGFLRLVEYIGISSGVFVPPVDAVAGGYLIVAGLSAATAALLVTILPTLLASRIPLAPVLNDRRPAAVAGARSWAVRGSIVGLQACLGLIVLVGAAFATRDLVRHLTFETGQRPRMDASVLPLRLSPAEPAVHAAAWDAVWEAAASVPAIDEVVLLSELPVRPAQSFVFVAGRDRPVSLARRFYRGRLDALLGIPVLEGAVSSGRRPEPSALLSRSAATSVTGTAAVPAAVRFDGNATDLAVAGVLDDVRFPDGDGARELTAYVPVADAPALGAGVRAMSLLFTCRTPCGEEQRAAVLSAIGPYAEPIAPPTTLRALYEPAARPAKARAAVANVYAAFALLVVLAGVYTLSGAVVLGSGFEAGIRLALGAQRADVVLRLLSRVCTPAALGIATGATLLLVVTHYVGEGGRRLPGATDLSIAATLLLTTTAVAALGPALFLVRQPLVSLLRREG